MPRPKKISTHVHKHIHSFRLDDRAEELMQSNLKSSGMDLPDFLRSAVADVALSQYVQDKLREAMSYLKSTIARLRPPKIDADGFTHHEFPVNVRPRLIAERIIIEFYAQRDAKEILEPGTQHDDSVFEDLIRKTHSSHRTPKGDSAVKMSFQEESDAYLDDPRDIYKRRVSEILRSKMAKTEE